MRRLDPLHENNHMTVRMRLRCLPFLTVVLPPHSGGWGNCGRGEFGTEVVESLAFGSITTTLGSEVSRDGLWQATAICDATWECLDHRRRAAAQNLGR